MVAQNNPLINPDGTLKPVVFQFVDPKPANGPTRAMDILNSLARNYDAFEGLRNTDERAVYSQAVIGDTSMTQLSGSDFARIKKAINTGIEEKFWGGNLIPYTPNLTQATALGNARGLENLLINKGAGTEVTAFYIPQRRIDSMTDDNEKNKAGVYNTVSHTIRASQERIQGIRDADDAYTHLGLDHISEGQQETLNALLGGNSKDDSKVRKIFEEDARGRAMGAVAEYGIAGYLSTNLGIANSERQAQNTEIQNYRKQISEQEDAINLGLRRDITISELHQEAEQGEAAIKRGYQNASSDAPTLLRGFARTSREAVKNLQRELAQAA